MEKSAKKKAVKGFYEFLFLMFAAIAMVAVEGVQAGEGTMVGYIQGRGEYGLKAPRRFSEAEILGNAELDYKFDEKLSFHTILRGRYDAIYDLRDDFKRDVAPADKDGMRTDGQVREIYFDYKPIESLSLRAGRQTVIWGESDGLRLMDMINPMDLKWGYLTRDFEDFRTPLTMLRVNYRVPGLEAHMAAVELVWIPVDFEVNQIPPPGSAWAPESPKFFNDLAFGLAMGAVPGVPFPTLAVLRTEERPRTLRNSRIGAKLAGKIAGTDLSLNYFHTYSDGAVYKFTGVGIGDAPANLFGITNTFNMEAKFPWKHIVGGTFNHDFGMFVARGEVAYEFKDQFQNLSKADFTEESDYIKAMLGFDYQLTIPGFNRGKTIFVSGQIFDFRIMDYNNDIVNIPYGYRVKEDETVLTLLVNTGFAEDKIKPEIFVAYDPSYNSWWVKPKLGLEYGSDWRIEMGANFFDGRNTQRLPFGAFEKDSSAYLQIRRMI